MNRRDTLPALLALAATNLPMCGFAQQAPSKIARIGFLGSTSAPSFAARVDVLRQGLQALGYVEHKNYEFEFRWADGVYERHAALAEELVRLKVDVIVTVGTPPTLAAKRATTTIPIVMVTVGDAVASGVVASLARQALT